MKCKNCGFENKDDVNVCEQCEEKIEKTVFEIDLEINDSKRYTGRFNRIEIKKHGKQKFSENYGGYTLIAGIVLAITMILGKIIPIVEIYFFGSLLIIPVLDYGKVKAIRTIRATNKVNVSNLFDGYKECFWGTVITHIIVRVKTILWTFLFVIPGIICFYRYYFVSYILVDNPKMDFQEVLALSNKITKGHKFELFIFDLSWILWWLGSVFTLGILVFYVIPYNDNARLDLYDAFVRESNKRTGQNLNG